MTDLLISYNDLSDRTPFFGEGEEKLHKANVAIKETQRKLKRILCDDTYTTLLTTYIAGTMDANYTVLYEYVREWLIWDAYAAYISFAQYTDTNVGLRVFSDENSQAASDVQVNEQMELAKNKADSYLSELRNYLYQNRTTYTEYAASTCYTCEKDRATAPNITGSGYRVSPFTIPVNKSKCC